MAAILRHRGRGRVRVDACGYAAVNHVAAEARVQPMDLITAAVASVRTGSEVRFQIKTWGDGLEYIRTLHKHTLEILRPGESDPGDQGRREPGQEGGERSPGGHNSGTEDEGPKHEEEEGKDIPRWPSKATAHRKQKPPQVQSIIGKLEPEAPHQTTAVFKEDSQHWVESPKLKPDKAGGINAARRKQGMSAPRLTLTLAAAARPLRRDRMARRKRARRRPRADSAPGTQLLEAAQRHSSGKRRMTACLEGQRPLEATTSL